MEGVSDGVYEQPFQVRRGYRHFVAVADGVQVAAVDVRIGVDEAEAVAKLEAEVGRAPRTPRLTVLH